MSAVVVGGGLAGLLAAYRLSESGQRVWVREASPKWGGMISPVDVAGVLVDSGAEAYATRGGAGHALAQELGLEVAAPESRPHVWWEDGAWPMADGLLGIPGSLDDPALGVLTEDERARVAEDFALDLDVGREATTIGELTRARLGEAAVRRLVSPIAEGIYASAADQLPLAVVAPGIHDAISDHGSLLAAVAALSAHRTSTVEQPIGGMFQLIEALVARLHARGADLRTMAAVTSIRRTANGAQVSTHDGETIQADRVILASPASVAARLLEGVSVEITPPPVHKARQVVLAASTHALREHPIGSGVIVADREAVRAKALTHYSAKWPWAAQRGIETLRLSYPEHVFPTRAEVLEDASQLTGVSIADDELLALASVSWDAMPSRIDPANRDHLVAVAQRAGINLIGAWVDGNGIGSVIGGVDRLMQ